MFINVDIKPAVWPKNSNLRLQVDEKWCVGKSQANTKMLVVAFHQTYKYINVTNWYMMMMKQWTLTNTNMQSPHQTSHVLC